MEEQVLASSTHGPRVGADTRSIGGTVRTVEAPSAENHRPADATDGLQLVGVPVAAGGVPMAGFGEKVASSVPMRAKAVVKAVESSVAKRKRGRPPRSQANPPPPKKSKLEEEEDVCFICFDGGSLVLCDRRGCPKAYHPSCIKRDEAFFRSKARWNCGWHICSNCQKAAYHMCYTCTYSLCRSCIKDADYVSVRGDRGLCAICMKTIMLIENSIVGKEEMTQVDFDDKTSWEYLFKVYWLYLKGKLSLTYDELTQAKNPWEGNGSMGCRTLLSAVNNGAAGVQCAVAITCGSSLPAVNNGSTELQSVGAMACGSSFPPANNVATELKSVTSCGSSLPALKNRVTEEKVAALDMPENLEATEKRKPNELPEVLHQSIPGIEKVDTQKNTMLVGQDWATQELLEFVAHMRNGDISVLPQFDVQELMLDYIKRNNLRDPRRKSQIICDLRLKNLFGKPRVGHFEMLKLLEFHFLIKEVPKKSSVHSVVSQVDDDWNSESVQMIGRDRKRKARRKGEERVPQTNLNEYAAIDVHNIGLIYLRRSLMESLVEDKEKFLSKVVGSVVRIRISGNDQKQDMHRLVQVVGTSKVDVPYKTGDKTTDVILEVLNLDKKESVSIDAISHQEFSGEECKRLRQSIRCGLVQRFSVGEIQEKAIALQSVRLNDWMEAEILRLNHLRDRASEKGHKKELRECVEKIQLLKMPEERLRRLQEVPVIHADPKMNPAYESEEDTGEPSSKKRGEYMKLRYSSLSGKGGKSNSPQTTAESSNDLSNRARRICSDSGNTSTAFHPDNGIGTRNSDQATVSSASISAITSETSASSMGKTPPIADGETDKLWHYRDPSSKIQGPFSMVQLQKWSTTGYFPPDMRIWASREDESLLLTDALKGQFHDALSMLYNVSLQLQEVGGASDCKKEKTNSSEKISNPINGSHLGSPLHERGNGFANYENHINGQGISGQSSGQNWSTKLLDVSSNNLYSSQSAAASVTTHNAIVEIPIMDSPRPIEGPIGKEKQVVLVQDSGIVELPSPTPKPSDKTEKPKDANGEKRTESANLATKEAGSSWSSGSSPLVNGGVQVVEMTSEWANVATPTSNINHLIHSSPSQPTSNMICEPIEFSTLEEESVSDLLAEVDALESQCGIASPTSKRSCNDDFMHQTIVEFSPTHDHGTRSDGFSSTGEAGATQVDPYIIHRTRLEDIFSNLFDVERETKSSEIPSSQLPTNFDSVGRKGTNLFHQSSSTPEAEAETKPATVSIEQEDDGEYVPTGPLTTMAMMEREIKQIDLPLEQEKGSELNQPNAALTLRMRSVDLNVAQKSLPEVQDTVWNTTKNSRSERELVEEDDKHTRGSLPIPMSSNSFDPSFERRTGSVNVNVGRHNVNTGRTNFVGNMGWESQNHHRRYNGERLSNNSPREKAYSQGGGDSSSRGRASWSRQQSFGAAGSAGGGYSRPCHKGQRVCKFYESGRCKKGAACDYLHQ